MLLQLGNFSIFLIILTNVFKQVIFPDRDEKYDNTFDYFLLIFHYSMTISYILRAHRLYVCTTINPLDDDLQTLNKIKTTKTFYEFLYMRILLISTFLLFLVLLMVYFFIPDNDISTSFLTILRMVIHCIEVTGLITYAFLISTRNVGYKISSEYFITGFILWTYFLSLDYLNISNDAIIPADYRIYIHYVFLGLLILVNTLYPLISSYIDNSNLLYKFPVELCSDLYIFLSIEECFEDFNKYLSGKREHAKGDFFMTLYLKLIKFRFLFMKPNEDTNLQYEATKILNAYFRNDRQSQSTNYIDTNLKAELNKTFEERLQSNMTSDLFDEALILCFNYLMEQFKEYQRTEEFTDLYNRLKYNCYIQTKLCSAGLILLNKGQ